MKITRKQAAVMLGISRRQFQRILKRFKEEGIEGLRKKSTRSKRSPNRIPEDVEKWIVEVRKATGFGPERITVIVNKGVEIEGRKRISNTTCYNVLARNGLVEAEKRMQKECRYFERGRPSELVQADITYFNGVPLMTMEDDHSRKGWATSMVDGSEDKVIHAMKALHPEKYENLLTDNGSQFYANYGDIKSPGITSYQEYLSKHKIRHVLGRIQYPQRL